LTQKKFQINSFYQGRSTRFEIELLDKKDIIAREWTKPVHSKTVNILPHIKLDLDTDSMDRPNFPSTDKDRITLKDFHQNQMTIKANFPDVYVHEKMNYLLSAIDNCFPLRELKVIPGTSTTQFVKNELNIRSIYVIAKVSCEFNSKLYALSKYITWTHQDNETDPVERMTDIPVLILHQDLYLLDDTLKEISTIFERALRWNKKEDPIEDLVNEVGILRYLFTHAMPYIRGSSAIGEWLEESIYKSHDLNFERRPGQSADLEALTAPTLDKFMNRHYKHTIWVSEPINDVKETV